MSKLTSATLCALSVFCMVFAAADTAPREPVGLIGPVSHRENTTWKEGPPEADTHSEVGTVTDDTILTVEWHGVKKEFVLESTPIKTVTRSYKRIYTTP